MSFYTEEFFEIQVENSSICNAACPQCVREIVSSDKSWLNETYLETDFFNRIPDEIYRQTTIFFFCGNLGDPCAAPNFLDVCRLVRSKNPDMLIKISTNGGLRPASFWSQLAEILGDRSEVVFAIDGLEDTNHIYRVNVQWNKVVENVKAFVSAGGKPFWQYITFKHNQHQVEQARILANELGFAKFIVKPSHRFVLDTMLNVDRYGHGGVKIEPPEEKELVHKVVIHKDLKKIKDFLKESENGKISCYAQDTRSIYIDHRGCLIPCCYLAAHEYVVRAMPVKDGWDTVWELHGRDRVNLKYNDWYEILSGPFFNSIAESWDKDYANGRLSSCALTCSDAKNRLNEPMECNRFVEESQWLNT
jgi:MoaA/NifB/PqqE/SkfB family radical SAM enzyme